MKSLQQAAHEFFDECVKNGVAPEHVAFKSICINDASVDSYLFQSASIEGKIVGANKSDDDELISETVANGQVTQKFKSGRWVTWQMPK